MSKMWKKEKWTSWRPVSLLYIHMRRDSWAQDALKLPNTQTGSLRPKGGRKCDDQDEDEDGQTHGDPNLLLLGERAWAKFQSILISHFGCLHSFRSDSYLARLLLIRHRLLGVLPGLLHKVGRLFDVGFDSVHHLPLWEAATLVGALGMTREQGSSTWCPQAPGSRPQAHE